MNNCTLSIDFESFGPSPSINGFVSLGAAIVAPDLKVVSTFFSYANQRIEDRFDTTFEFKQDERCMNEFWRRDENKENLEKAMKHCYDPKTPPPDHVLWMFWKWLHATVKEFDLKDVLLIGDCIPYELVFLARFSSDDIDVQRPFGVYAEWTDVCSYYRGLARVPITNTLISDTYSKSLALDAIRKIKNDESIVLPAFITQHDHDPVHDAINVGQTFQWFRNQLTN